jgi:hypothetical protein
MTSYYRRFVPGFASIAAPLHKLVGEKIGKRWKAKSNNNQPLGDSWTSEHQHAFDELKLRLSSAPILAFPDFSYSFILEIDASDKGMGAVLSQEINSVKRVVSYASRGLRGSEKNMTNYSSKKLELLALKWAVTEKYRDYLSFAPCRVLMDNNPLTYLLTKSKIPAIEQKWASELAHFDIRLEYKPGRQNACADALSRQAERPWDIGSEEVLSQCHSVLSGTPLSLELQLATFENTSIEVRAEENDSPHEGTATLLPRMTKQKMMELQSHDHNIAKVMEYKNSGFKPPVKSRKWSPLEIQLLLRQWDKLMIIESVLYRKNVDPKQGKLRQVVLPSALRQEVLGHMHDGHGHQAFDRTYCLLKTRCYWPKMGRDLENWINHCNRCILAKEVKVRTPLGTIQASGPLEVLAIDYTLLDKSSSGYEKSCNDGYIY